jgi:hypothetical protein
LVHHKLGKIMYGKLILALLVLTTYLHHEDNPMWIISSLKRSYVSIGFRKLEKIPHPKLFLYEFVFVSSLLISYEIYLEDHIPTHFLEFSNLEENETIKVTRMCSLEENMICENFFSKNCFCISLIILKNILPSFIISNNTCYS